MRRAKEIVRRQLGSLFSGQRSHVLHNRPPVLEDKFQDIDQFGLYLHIPFCRRICPYCPYNKELFDPILSERYADAVVREVDRYAELIGDRPITSFYIGGGTPTTMLHAGLPRVLNRIRQVLDLRCAPHLESHPNDLSPENLDLIESLGVRYLSVGVEALQDRHLRTLQRPYTVAEAKAAVRRAVARGFECVNADTIFALPGQTLDEVQEAGRALVELGIDQVAAYPLFQFPHTGWPRLAKDKGYRRAGLMARRRMLRMLEEVFADAGFERSSVWAFTRRGVEKYCSVTVPLYVGLGASGGTYLRDVFYLNTFRAAEYVRALEDGRLPIALVLDLPERVRMAKWLYWRIYETRFATEKFRERFGRDFDQIFGRYMNLLALGGFLHRHDGEIVLTSRGAYWLHVVEDLFSIDHIAKLWGAATKDPWPQKVVL